MTVDKRLAALRREMKKHAIDVCYVGTADPHFSEYVAPHFRSRAYLSGFTGSAGTLIVTADQALVWADGRYHIQAERETAQSDVTVMKLGAPDVPSPLEWLKREIPSGSRLAIEGRLYSDREITHMEQALAGREVTLVTDLDLITPVWPDRPPLPQNKVVLHDLAYSGEPTASKLSRLRAKMAEVNADYALYVGLDDIMWILNIRGSDVPNNPVALAFLLIGRDSAVVFIDPEKTGPEVLAAWAEAGVTAAPYTAVEEALASLDATTILLDRTRVSRALVKALPETVTIVHRRDAPQIMKAVLNETQRTRQIEAGIRDSLCVTAYLHYVKTRAVDEGENEYTVDRVLHDLRARDPRFIDESFSTISAYGPNAAMMHYKATEEANTPLAARGFYLVDCGVQMLDGTTDITRTVALGPLTEEEKEAYTLTLRSHIALASLPFLKGTAGVALDAVARSVMWREHVDYKCGTGHGVGFVGGVHEGPQRLTGNVRYGGVPFEPGMVITIEPGIYAEGAFGIRLENDYLVVTDDTPPNQQNDTFYRFEPFTFVPFDREAILPERMTRAERDWLNAYHARVRDTLLPLTEDGALRDFICEQTAPLD